MFIKMFIICIYIKITITPAGATAIIFKTLAFAGSVQVEAPNAGTFVRFAKWIVAPPSIPNWVLV